MLMGGPISMADIPVPQGWEQVPAVGTGIGMQEIIKTIAAISPTKGLNDKSVEDIFFNRYNPYATNGAATANHNTAQLKGNIPSEICIASASEAANIPAATQNIE